MILSPPPDPAWIQNILRDAEHGKRHANVCYDTHCNHGIVPHPKLGDCPWWGPEPSRYGFNTKDNDNADDS
jgi:hypothetical protein